MYDGLIVVQGQLAPDITKSHGSPSSNYKRGLRTYDPESGLFGFVPLDAASHYSTSSWPLRRLISTDNHLFAVGAWTSAGDMELLHWDESSNKV